MTTAESNLEDQFIEKLRGLKYEYRPDIRDRAALEANFRQKFEALNCVRLTDSEFARLLDEIITSDVFTAAQTLRGRNAFTRDDGTPLNYTLVNIRDWCKNHFEVINQLRINTDNSHHRYDVILLINGVPVVQVELKTLGISPRRAMEQIVDYKNDPGNGYTKTLLCFIQLFIVSNRDRTYYFANNNTRHFAFNAEERFLPVYEFADEENKKITHLDAFAERFLRKCDLGKTISRYMVLVVSEQRLMIMRPYQVYAVQRIVQCIDDDSGNGYIWHTTGSGKTLTSFKASTLLKENERIHKCVFVVDRKDLDRQTREEFNRFQEGCVEENTNTATLVRRLLSEDYADKVIVTTIQKLGLALDEGSKRNKQRKKKDQATYKELLEPLRDKRIVFIFDECHRSQFGENHRTIKAFFPRAQLFGFTGTPIFEANATSVKIESKPSAEDPDKVEKTLQTTVDLFQKELHSYTITNAIDDGNVLRFHVDYFKPEGKKLPKPGEALAKKAVIDAILSKHDAATGERRFNAILATASISHAIEYFQQFNTEQKALLDADPNFRPLNIACVFSPPAEGNSDVKQIQEDLPQESEEYEVQPGEDADEKKKENERKKQALIAGSSYKHYLLLKKNDFAYNKSATKEYPEGFIALYSGDELAAVPNSIFTCFRIKGDSPAPEYLNYLLLGNLHGRWLRKFIEVGARAHGSLSIDEDDLLALPVPLPSGKASVREQQKIAECLSSVDELLAAQARKVDALKTHKKGLMQQLFPREGETQPRLRFPEFQDAGEWEVRPLGIVAENLDNRRVPIASSDRKAGEVPYYGASGVVDHVAGFIFDENLLCVSEDGANLVARTYPIKDIAKHAGHPDTLYFNAFTEDLFSWHNDLENDNERYLMLHPSSKFFAGLEELEMDNRIRPLLQRYADFDFRLDTIPLKNDEGKTIGERRIVRFWREVVSGGTTSTVDTVPIAC